MWLRAALTNHHPGLIANYFVQSVDQAGGYPRRVRTDCGTENNTLAAIQCLVADDTSAHVYGTSPGNQQIEACWSFFRKYRSQWWIELFKSLIEFGAFHPGCEKEVECLHYCFMSVLQDDLDSVRHEWNTHRIRPSVGARCPAGVPDELFYLPQPPAVNCLITGTPQLLQQMLDELEEPTICDSSDFKDYLDYICTFNGWQRPMEHESATQLVCCLFTPETSLHFASQNGNLRIKIKFQAWRSVTTDQFVLCIVLCEEIKWTDAPILICDRMYFGQQTIWMLSLISLI